MLSQRSSPNLGSVFQEMQASETSVSKITPLKEVVWHEAAWCFCLLSSRYWKCKISCVLKTLEPSTAWQLHSAESAFNWTWTEQDCRLNTESHYWCAQRYCNMLECCIPVRPFRSYCKFLSTITATSIASAQKHHPDVIWKWIGLVLCLRSFWHEPNGN